MSQYARESISRSPQLQNRNSCNQVDVDVSPPDVQRWLAGPWPSSVERRISQLLAMPDIVRAAVLPDVHVAGNVCVGLAIATVSRIYPELAGADIGCGMLAVPFAESAKHMLDRTELQSSLRLLRGKIPIRRQRSKGLMPHPSGLTSDRLSSPKLQKLQLRVAVPQFGTLGHGNHFVELMQAESDGRFWLVVHTGSRGIGRAISDHHRDLADQTDSPIGWLDAHSDMGKNYLADADWATRYASENRHAIATAAAAVLKSLTGGDLCWDEAIETPHDFVREESHQKQKLFVHRKGVQPLANGDLGILPSCVGRSTLIVRGRDTSTSLGSISHGCGRILSRREAAMAVSPRTLKREQSGIVTNSQCVAEAPQAFRDLRDVLKAQRDLLVCVERLKPLLCYKSER